ncbi:MAG: hypothetical protein ACPGR2_02990 [Psychrobium sp.]
MDKIKLQSKTQALKGTVELDWFENQNIGLEKTLFHRITIPLKPFNSGLDYDEQPVNTKIELDWYELGLAEPTELHGLDLNHQNYPSAEASLYLGSAHNWCDVKALKLTKNADGSYSAFAELNIEFENEGVAENELFIFQTILEIRKI